MVVKRVIAYSMHEDENRVAQEALGNALTTESYVIGDIEDDQVEELRGRGLVVDDFPEPGPTTTAGATRDVFARRRGARSPRVQDENEPPPGVPAQWLVSLDGPLLDEMRAAVDATGTRLDEYVPNHAYVATATPEQATECLGLAFVRDVTRYDPALTRSVPLVAAANRRGFAPSETAWDLWLTAPAEREPLLAWLAEHEVGVEGSGGRRIRLSPGAAPDVLDQVSAIPGILSMVEHVPPKLFNNVARELLGITSEGPDDSPPPYTGVGQVVAVADTGLMETHPDLKDRILEVIALGRPGDPSDPHGHGTHVAGSAVGDGRASAGRYRGVAPGAQLYFQSLLDDRGGLGGVPVDLSQLFQPAYAAGARIHNNSWGAATQSAYTVDSNDVDEYVATHPDMLVVIAAGNEGTGVTNLNAGPGFVDWLSIGSPASCKNALTVGAARSSRRTGGLAARTYQDAWPDSFPEPPIATQQVSGDPECLAAFSSRGPCDDRRIKPDVVAPGTDIISTRSDLAPDAAFWALVTDNSAYAYLGGTSMACPLVSGCAALVREYYASVSDTQPSAALVKATIINGTRWLRGVDSVADHERLPNYHQGFGAVWMPTTLPHAGEETFRLHFIDSWRQPEVRFQKTGGRFRFRVQVDGGLPLRICMAYTDLPGRALQNDLSLLVQDPTGRKLVGNADLPGKISQSDAENNVEVVRVEEPGPGTWLIQVFARNLLRSPQDFALVVSGALGSALQRMPG